MAQFKKTTGTIETYYAAFHRKKPDVPVVLFKYRNWADDWLKYASTQPQNYFVLPRRVGFGILPS